MKPNWKDAPEWANYLAKDGGIFGEWYWYEYEPLWNFTWGYFYRNEGKSGKVTHHKKKGILEKRPF